MFNRPTLPPMAYRLWVPSFGAYVRETERNNRQIVSTIDRSTALQLPEPQAVAKARALIQRTRETIELRPVERSE